MDTVALGLFQTSISRADFWMDNYAAFWTSVPFPACGAHFSPSTISVNNGHTEGLFGDALCVGPTTHGGVRSSGDAQQRIRTSYSGPGSIGSIGGPMCIHSSINGGSGGVGVASGVGVMCGFGSGSVTCIISRSLCGGERGEAAPRSLGSTTRSRM